MRGLAERRREHDRQPVAVVVSIEWQRGHQRQEAVGSQAGERLAPDSSLFRRREGRMAQHFLQQFQHRHVGQGPGRERAESSSCPR